MHGMQPLNMEVEREDLRKTHKKIKPKPLVCCRHSITNQCTCTLQYQGWRHSHHALCPYQELQREFRKEIFFPFRKEAFSRRTYVKKYCSCYSHCAPVSAEGWETLHSTQKCLPPITQYRGISPSVESWPILARQWNPEITQKGMREISVLNTKPGISACATGYLQHETGIRKNNYKCN